MNHPACPIFDARSATMHRTSGWERYVRRISQQFAAGGEVTVWTSTAEPLARRLISDVDAARLTRSGRVVHFPTFPPQWAARSSRVVLTIHDLTWWKYPETSSPLGRLYYRPALERAVPRSAVVVTHSNAVAQEVRDYFGLREDRVVPVYCGAGLETVPVGSSGPPRQKPYLLTVATQEPRKNLDRLIRAYQSSAIRHDVDLLIVGRAAWGARPQGVEVAEDVDDRALVSLYRGAEALILPSLYEGFGLPLVEAMALGTPVLCSDIPVFREVTNEDASFFDPLSVESIAHALGGYDSVPLPSQETQDIIAERYSWKAVSDRLLDVYRRIA